MNHPFTYAGPLPILSIASVLHLLEPETEYVRAPETRGAPAVDVPVVRVRGVAYLRCPTCGRKAKSIYVTRGAWECFKCAGLKHKSTTISGRTRDRYMIERLQARDADYLTPAEKEYLESRVSKHEEGLRTRLPRPAAETVKKARDVDVHRLMYNTSHMSAQARHMNKMRDSAAPPVLPAPDIERELAARGMTRHGEGTGSYHSRPPGPAQVGAQEATTEAQESRARAIAELAKPPAAPVLRFNGYDDMGAPVPGVDALRNFSMW